MPPQQATTAPALAAAPLRQLTNSPPSTATSAATRPCATPKAAASSCAYWAWPCSRTAGWAALAAVVPAHRTQAVAELARECARVWHGFAERESN